MPSRMSRRSFLAGSAGALALAACGGSDNKVGASGGTGATSSSASRPALTMLTFTDTSALVPGSPQRVTLGLADQDGVVVDSPPAPTIQVSITANGQAVGSPLTLASHQQGLPKPYYPLEFTPPAAGVYTITTNVNGLSLEMPVQIPASTEVVGPGQKMIPLDTPTATDQRGVELLCTHTPPCPLHDVTLREALAGGTPVAFLIATPQFCQTAICGPVLDVLLSEVASFPQVKMLHSEVYPSAAAAQPPNQQLVEAVTAYNLSFEPVLYLAGADGTIVKRLDTVFDAVELHDALAQLTG